MPGNELEKNSTLNERYQIRRVLGSGGFGITYAALDMVLDQTVVVKEYFPALLAQRGADGRVEVRQDLQAYREGKSRFLQEARTLASLFDIPGIVKVLGFFEENETAYIVMEHVKGISLRNYLEQREQGFSFAEACRMMRPVMDALEKVHKKKLIHRDISPDNLMVEETGTIKLLDFGAARTYLQENDREKTMTVLVKNSYAPPEQYDPHGRQGPWTDVYALCATMYEMMTGYILPDAQERQIRDDVYPLTSFNVQVTPEQEEAFLKKGLALEPEKRYASIREMRVDFFPEEKEKQKKRKTKQYLAVAGAVLLAAGAAGIAGYQKTWAQQDSAPQIAGNYARGSQEYEEFLAFVKENAVAVTETDEEGIRYELTREAVLELGLSGNGYLLNCTCGKMVDHLESLGYALTWESQKEYFYVWEEPYGVLRADFYHNDRYRVQEDIQLKICYDLVSEKIYQIDLLTDVSKTDALFPCVLDTVDFLTDYLAAEDRQEDLEDFQSTFATYYQEKSEGRNTIRGYTYPEIALRFKIEKEDGQDRELGGMRICSLYADSMSGDYPPYCWP